MFGCPLKFIFGISTFLAINQNIHTQLCMNVKILPHELSLIRLFNFSHLYLFQDNVIRKK
jgi:hypothetical protein